MRLATQPTLDVVRQRHLIQSVDEWAIARPNAAKPASPAAAPLRAPPVSVLAHQPIRRAALVVAPGVRALHLFPKIQPGRDERAAIMFEGIVQRSEERRVGKEC